jgi:hypothetical protein
MFGGDFEKNLVPKLPGTDYKNTITVSAKEKRIHDASTTVPAILRVRKGAAWAWVSGDRT